MKVLFAMGSSQKSKSIVDRYYEKFGETLEYKDVFYFKALLDEVKRDKSYNTIIINEDLEQYKAKDIEQIDRKLFSYVDSITDEAQDADIIYICSDNRSKEDQFIVRLYSIGIYNILLGDDRNINTLCEIIKKPKTKREAKEYLNIDSGSINETGITRDDEVDETQMMNILNYYDKIKNEPEKYVETFERISSQYNQAQLKVIVSWLPKAVQEAIYNEPKYKVLLTYNGLEKPKSSQENDQNTKKVERKHSQDFFGVFKKSKEKLINSINHKNEKGQAKESVYVEEEKNPDFKDAKEIIKEAKRDDELRNIDDLDIDIEIEDAKSIIARAEKESKLRLQEDIIKQENEDTKIKEQQELMEKAKKEAEERMQQELAEKAKKEAEEKEQQELAEKAKKEAEERMQQELAEKAKKDAEERAQQELMEKAKKEAEEKAQQELIEKAKEIKSTELTIEQKQFKEEQEKLALEQEKIRKIQAELEEEKRKLLEEQAKIANAKNNPVVINQIEEKEAYDVMTVTPINYKKMVAFVGVNKAGTTFMVNSVAHRLAEQKIVTSILDMTRDKSMYYIYNQGDSDLRKIANECMKNLSNEEDSYLPVSKYLKVYTTIPGGLSDSRRSYKHKSIIETVKNNSNVTIIDADFTTPIDYFENASEIYIVQDMDILKMQETTMFLREMKNRNIDMSKIKIIINKYVKNMLTPKKIIEGLSYYKDPEMTFIDKVLNNKVMYSVIPYNLNNYVKYTESLYKGTMSFKGYTTDFTEAINEIVNQIYTKNGMVKKAKKRNIWLK